MQVRQPSVCPNCDAVSLSSQLWESPLGHHEEEQWNLEVVQPTQNAEPKNWKALFQESKIQVCVDMVGPVVTLGPGPPKILKAN